MNHKRLDRLREMLAAEPDDPFLHYGVAMEHLSAEDWTAALAAFQDLQAKFPHYVPTYYQYGKLLFETGKGQESMRILRQGMDVARAAGDRHALGELSQLLEDIED